MCGASGRRCEFGEIALRSDAVTPSDICRESQFIVTIADECSRVLNEEETPSLTALQTAGAISAVCHKHGWRADGFIKALLEFPLRGCSLRTADCGAQWSMDGELTAA